MAPLSLFCFTCIDEPVLKKIMIMKRLLFLVVLMVSILAVSAQTTTLTFTGRDANNHFIPLNRVSISNLTKGWQETIYYPDTILVMNSVGIEDYGNVESFNLSQNVPNPFDGTSDFSLCLPKEGPVLIEVYDLNGKKITSYNNTLAAGCHNFRVLLSTAQSYLLTARSGNDHASIKMVNAGNAGANALHYLGEGNMRPLSVELNNAKGQSQHSFTSGDLMEYVGYATVNGEEYESHRIQQQQNASESFILNFDCVSNPNITLQSLTVTNVLANSVTLSATVTSNTDGQQIQRGFQYSTDASFANAVDVACGTGNGNFSANITGLQEATLYYVRAFATYHTVTSYGDATSFTTLCNPLSINITGNTSICIGNSTVLTASGANTYLWSPATGLNVQSGSVVEASPSVSTVYTVTGTAANGCTGTASIFVAVNPTYNVGTTASICPGEIYDFYGQQLSEAGTYTHTLQSVNGCDSVITLSLSYKTIPNISIAGNTTICQGESTVLTASGADSYVWVPATGLSSTSGSVVTASPSATNNYTVSGTAANGCTGYANVLVTVLPTANTTINASICQGTQYPFFGQQLTVSGTYTHTLQTTQGCDSVITLNLTVNSLPTITISGNNSICNGGYTTLTANGADTYQWAPVTGLNVQTEATVIAAPASTITYTILGTDANGCINSGTVTVTVNPVYNTNRDAEICQGEVYPFFGQNLTASGTYTHILQSIHGCDSIITLQLTVKQTPTVSIVGNTEICQGSNTILAANGAIAYQWSPTSSLNPTTGNIVTASPSVSTLYTVVGTAANGCSNTATVYVNVYESQNTTIADNFCQGEVYDFYGQQLTQGGVYTHTLQNIHGCDSVITLILTQKNAPSVSITGTRAICENGSTILTANGANSYQWLPAEGMSTTSGPVVVVTPTVSTSYTVIGTAANGCTGSATATVDVYPVFQTNIAETICPGESYDFFGQHLTAPGTYSHTLQTIHGCDSVITLTLIVPTISIAGNTEICQNGSTTLSVTGVNNAHWAPATGLNTTDGNTVVASPESNTAYTVTGTSTTGCNLSATVTIVVHPQYSVNRTASICQGASYDFYGQQLTASGHYSHTFQSVYGCDSVINLQLTVYPLPTLSVVGEHSICMGRRTTLTASGADTYQWTPATGLNTTTGHSVVASPSETTTYNVYGTDENGCVSSMNHTLTVYANPTITITGNTTVNYGASTTLTASGASTYQWSTSATGNSVTVHPESTTHYSVTGTNTYGCSSTQGVEVTVVPIAPSVSTQNVTNVSDSSAMVSGTLLSHGGDANVSVGFQYSLQNNFTNAQTISASVENFTANITGLAMSTTYYVRAYATNAVGTSYGSTMNFTTLSCNLPTVTTNTVDTNLRTKISVTVSGKVSNNGGCQVLNKGFCYSTNNYPTLDDNVVIVDTNSNNFTAVLTGLQPLTTYYVRAFAVNHAGVAYGSRMQFKTLSANLAELTTTEVSNIQAYTATSGGRVLTSGHPVTARGVCWSTSHTPTISGSHTTDGSGVGSFTSSLTGLTDGVTYYVRAYATIDEGTSYGNEVSFTTLSLPVLTTNNPTNVTSNTVTLGGNISNQGADSVTEKGVCYGLTANPTIAGNHKIVGSGIGSFSCNLTGLNAGTTYYVRAYATNGRGTAYGAQKTFTTASFTCGTSTMMDIDSNIYHTVLINDQCWMKENLRTTRYSSGAAIALGSDISSTTAYRYYPDDNNTIVNTYGYLYNWAAVMNGSLSDNAVPSGVQGICPTGWHVPSDAEWTAMTTYVSNQLQYLCNENSANIAKALASTTGWSSSTNSCAVGNNPSSNNATGFSVMPAGGCYEGTTYKNFGTNGYLWVATKNSEHRIHVYGIGAGRDTIEAAKIPEDRGYSVRCLRDVAGLPSVVTKSVTNITGTSASTGGFVESQGNSPITARGVCWSTSPNPTINDNYTTDGTGVGNFTSSMTGLALGTTYYVRAYATNSAGTSYGEQRSFTTLGLPSVATAAVTNNTGATANSGGNIANDGGAAVIARGICWSTSQNPTISNNKTTNGTGTGSFTSSMTGLTQGTTYYVRAYATNSVGTGYGNQISFTWQCGTDLVADIQGNTYNTVQIGTQCWMKENMKSTKTADGTNISYAGPNSYPSGLDYTSSFYLYPGKNSANINTYGLLYTWPAANQVCPTGWKLPTDYEWKTMEMAVGMGESVVTRVGEWRGYIAARLSGNIGWASSSTANAAGNISATGRNSSGFSAIPAGVAYTPDDIRDFSGCAWFWTSTPDEDSGYGYAYCRELSYDKAGVYRDDDKYKGYGMSVRCIKRQ